MLGAMYLRLVGTSLECYNYLEPLYNDYRKVKRRNRGGGGWGVGGGGGEGEKGRKERRRGRRKGEERRIGKKRRGSILAAFDGKLNLFPAEFELLHVDEFIEELLHDERSCDIIIPRIQVQQSPTL